MGVRALRAHEAVEPALARATLIMVLRGARHIGALLTREAILAACARAVLVFQLRLACAVFARQACEAIRASFACATLEGSACAGEVGAWATAVET